MAGHINNSTNKLVFVCVRDPPKVNSLGYFSSFNTEQKRNPFIYSLPVLEFQIVLIFMLTHLLHFPLKRLGIPKLVSEIVAGLILGSTVLGRKENYQMFLFPAASQGILGAFSTFGYLLFQFLSGVKMDTGMIRKTGSKALAIGVLNLVAPLLFGWITMSSLRTYQPREEDDLRKKVKLLRNGIGVLVSHSMTAFPVIAVLLKDLKILNSELGRLAMSSGLINHLLEVTLTSIYIVYFLALRKQQMSGPISDLFGFIGLVLIVIFIIRPALRWVVKQTPEGRPVKDLYIYLVILLALGSGVFTHYFELTVLLGPFIVGLAVPEGPPLGSALVDKLEAFSSGVLLPTFISLVTLRTDLYSINYSFAHTILIVVPFLSKTIACSLIALYCKMPLNDAIALGLIMSTKGVVDLATYSFVRDEGMIDQGTFALLVVATAVIATFVPFMVQLLYDPNRKYAGYQKRNIMRSRHDGKLPIVACIHRSDNIMAIIRLLDASTPTAENPITVHALHLIELHGRASSIFISHQAQKKTDSNLSYSENVILAFKQFERNNWGAVTVQAFTAVSPRQLMQEDICTLALDVLASLIIVPFHRKWAIDGSVESEDNSLRTLNRNVLERAPCSVGILIDRSRLGRSSSMTSSEKTYCVVLLFIGGKDDQEALTLAKRMTRNVNVNLTIVRCISKGREGSDMEDDMLDMKVLYDFKQNGIGQGNVTYLEKVVNDSLEMARLLLSVADEYDLILVGRRYNTDSALTSGFQEWSDVPELGAVGDFLSSKDLIRKASILIVQQQKISH